MRTSGTSSRFPRLPTAGCEVFFPWNVPVPLVRKEQPFGAEPKPHLTCGTQFGKLVEDRADRTRDGLVGMKNHLAFAFAPEQAHGQPTAQFSAFGFVADRAIEAQAQDVQFGFGHGAFKSQQQPIIE